MLDMIEKEHALNVEFNNNLNKYEILNNAMESLQIDNADIKTTATMLGMSSTEATQLTSGNESAVGDFVAKIIEVISVIVRKVWDTLVQLLKAAVKIIKTLLGLGYTLADTLDGLLSGDSGGGVKAGNESASVAIAKTISLKDSISIRQNNIAYLFFDKDLSYKGIVEAHKVFNNVIDQKNLKKMYSIIHSVQEDAISKMAGVRTEGHLTTLIESYRETMLKVIKLLDKHSKDLGSKYFTKHIPNKDNSVIIPISYKSTGVDVLLISIDKESILHIETIKLSKYSIDVNTKKELSPLTFKELTSLTSIFNNDLKTIEKAVPTLEKDVDTYKVLKGELMYSLDQLQNKLQKVDVNKEISYDIKEYNKFLKVLTANVKTITTIFYTKPITGVANTIKYTGTVNKGDTNIISYLKASIKKGK